MLIIDQHAEEKLAKRLHEAWFDHSVLSPRYIYFPLHAWCPEGIAHAAVQARIVELATEYLSGDIQLYLLRHHDVLLVASPLPRQEANALIVALAEQYQCRADESFSEYQELRHGAGKLLAMLEQRQLDEARSRAEDQVRQAQLRKVERREQILSVSSLASAGDIATRRSGRDRAEFMIIEDDAFSARLVENLLRKQYAVTTLNAADKALQTYAQKAPDMLLLDINLPDVTGHELLESILRMDPNAYVVMLSAHSDVDNVKRALQRGAKGFVTKPFSQERLMQYVERCPTLQH